MKNIMQPGLENPGTKSSTGAANGASFNGKASKGRTASLSSQAASRVGSILCDVGPSPASRALTKAAIRAMASGVVIATAKAIATVAAGAKGARKASGGQGKRHDAGTPAADIDPSPLMQADPFRTASGDAAKEAAQAATAREEALASRADSGAQTCEPATVLVPDEISRLGEEKGRKQGDGDRAHGGFSSAGALKGAAIGSCLCPGLGTVIGGFIGAYADGTLRKTRN